MASTLYCSVLYFLCQMKEYLRFREKYTFVGGEKDWLIVGMISLLISFPHLAADSPISVGQQSINLTFRPLDIQPSLLPQGRGRSEREIGNFHLHLPFLDEQKREFRGKREEKKVGGGALIATSPDQGTKERRDSPRV